MIGRPWNPGGGHVRLHRHRGVLEGRLGHAHLLQGDVPDGILAADDDRIHRRQPGEVGRKALQVGGSPVGQEEDPGERPALEPVGQRAERAAEDGGAAVEVQLVEIRRGLQPGVEEVAPDLEGVRERGEPGGPGRIDEGAQGFPARLRRARVPHLQALAVVRQDGEEVGSRPGVLAEPERLEQAEPERGQRRRLQAEAGPAQPPARRGPVAPGEHEEAEDEVAADRRQPAPPREGQHRQQEPAHLSPPSSW